MKQVPKPKGTMEKLVKGIIIGGAIGSVVGIGISPKNKHTSTKQEEKKPEKPSKKSKGLLSSFGRGIKILITGKK